MAQTAESEGKHVAKFLTSKIKGDTDSLPIYTSKEPAYAVPVGEKWAVVQWGGSTYSGYVGWILRRLVDLKYFLSILPASKAYQVFREADIPYVSKKKVSSKTVSVTEEQKFSIASL
jgi:NADH dehydrogenase FAD-containing subunit